MEYEAEAKHNEEIAKVMEYQKLKHEFEMELYVNKSQQNVEIYKTRWNDCQKDYERCKKDKEKLQDEKSDYINCQHAKNTCVRDKDACTQQLKEKKIKHEECLNDTNAQTMF